MLKEYLFQAVQIAFNGLGWQDVALSVTRFLVGGFFFLSGYHKLYVWERHLTMRKTLETCGIPCVGFFVWFVSGIEFLAGAFVMFGLMTPLASTGLLAICLVALCTDGPQKVRSYKPLDKGDAIDDWLYLPETWLALLLVIFMTGGGGSLSMDGLIRYWH